MTSYLDPLLAAVDLSVRLQRLLLEFDDVARAHGERADSAPDRLDQLVAAARAAERQQAACDLLAAFPEAKTRATVDLTREDDHARS